MKYRIYYSHCMDAPTNEIHSFSDDKVAIEEFTKMQNAPHNRMDRMWMERIDIEEQVTYIKTSQIIK